jgi:hypothetical protein
VARSQPRTAQPAALMIGRVAPAPDASRLAAHCFVAACVEVINGFRPASHLRALFAPAAFNDVVDQLARRAPRLRGQAVEVAVGRWTARPKPPPPTRLRHLRVGAPRPGVVECAAVLGCDQRVWAMAIRLEHHCGRWACTDIRVM